MTQKGYFGNLDSIMGYMRIYCRCVEIVCELRMRRIFLGPHTAHRWTAIAVGAIRHQTASDPLADTKRVSFRRPYILFVPTLCSVRGGYFSTPYDPSSYSHGIHIPYGLSSYLAPLLIILDPSILRCNPIAYNF